MALLIAFLVAKIGSKRVIGGFTSFMLCLLMFPVGIILTLQSRMLCLLMFPVGIILTLQSRRLDDEAANSLLLAKYKVNQP